ncbi:collagen alpha-1(I) chain-like [Corvus moneduloides]|uniref:collagen alpha-1(I) chain-like n=1 Tax=Corvus moneduloides TaxID=1196302 RepID=UPI001362A43A|nr:collagen alpha-1(I) chain-like [Corvus moneduloides]
MGPRPPPPIGRGAGGQIPLSQWAPAERGCWREWQGGTPRYPRYRPLPGTPRYPCSPRYSHYPPSRHGTPRYPGTPMPPIPMQLGSPQYPHLDSTEPPVTPGTFRQASRPAGLPGHPLFPVASPEPWPEQSPGRPLGPAPLGDTPCGNTDAFVDVSPPPMSAASPWDRPPAGMGARGGGRAAHEADTRLPGATSGATPPGRAPPPPQGGTNGAAAAALLPRRPRAARRGPRPLAVAAARGPAGGRAHWLSPPRAGPPGAAPIGCAAAASCCGDRGARGAAPDPTGHRGRPGTTGCRRPAL